MFLYLLTHHATWEEWSVRDHEYKEAVIPRIQDPLLTGTLKAKPVGAREEIIGRKHSSRQQRETVANHVTKGIPEPQKVSSQDKLVHDTQRPLGLYEQ